MMIKDFLLKLMDEQPLKDVFWGNTTLEWLRSLILFLVLLGLLILLRLFFTFWFRSFKKVTTDKRSPKYLLLFFLKKTYFWVLIVFAFYFSTKSLNLPSNLMSAFRFALIFSGFYQVIVWANSVVNIYSDHYMGKGSKPSITPTTFHIFTLILKVAIFSILTLTMLGMMGLNITALLAGLGVGGIAVAFALQNLLGDVFASLAIIFDKPFKVGDLIKVSDFTARVEKVGLKTTRLRNRDGEQLIYSNGEILKQIIQNYGDINQRRALFQIGITYETPYDRIKIIPDLLREIILNQKETRVDYIFCKQFSDSSINFEVVYYANAPIFGDWVQIQHAINMNIMKAFDEKGISFAYPTRTVYTKNLSN